MTSVLGIDVGTSGCKAILVAPDGRVMGSGHAGYELRRPAPHRVEIDPETWLEAAARAVASAVGEGRACVDAVGISSSNATVLVDSDERPVMPAIMQLDRRSRHAIGKLTAALGEEALLERTGNVPGAGVSWLANLGWLRSERPEALARTRSVLFPGGYLALRMTGIAAVDPSRASTTGLFDPRRTGWCGDLARAVGVEVAQLPAIAGAGEVVGRLRPSMAAALGLRAGTPVVAGAMDSAAAALPARALEPGDAVVVLGTMARMVAVTDRFAPRRRVLTACHVVSDRWIGMRVLWGAGRHIAAAAALWSDRPDYARLAREVPTVPPGSEGVRFAAGSAGGLGRLEAGLSGVRPGHTAAHVARAVLEGVLAEVVSASPLDDPGRTLSLCGGPTRSSVVPQLLADLTGRVVAVPDVEASEPLGAAMCAAAAGALAKDVRAAASSLAPRARTFAPCPDAHRAYRTETSLLSAGFHA